MVVFDRIARFDHPDLLQPVDRAQKVFLHVDRQRGADPVGIDQRRIQPLRLKKDLVPVAIAKAVDLVLDRGAIARTLPVYRARLGKDPLPIPFSRELAGSTLLAFAP